MDIIKPIKLIPRVQQGELPDSKITKNRGSPIDTSIPLTTGRWNFVKGVLVLDGKNITQIIEELPNQPTAYWSKLVQDLETFREEFLKKNSKKHRKKIDSKNDQDLAVDEDLGKLSALVDAYIAKLARLLKRKYDEKTDGIAYTLDEDGQLTLNGMNVNAFIIMSRNFPSDKAKLFLKGLKNRLGIILSNKNGNSNYDKIQETIMDLFEKIDIEMNRSSIALQAPKE